MAEDRIRRIGTLGVLVLMACLGLPRTALADEVAAKGREIVAKWSGAVVSLRVVAKIRMSVEGKEKQEDERTNEAKATVIDPSGLVVASLSDVDPNQAFETMMEEDAGFKMQAELTDIKIQLADGKEIPAKIVLRDKELDLAYLRPTVAPEKPLTAVDLADSAKPAILDEIIVLGRTGEAANRAPSAYLDRIIAVAEKPRTLYVPGVAAMMAGLGCPVFALDGKPVGVLVLRSLPQQARSAGNPGAEAMPVIIPAADVMEGKKQIAP